MPGPLSEQFVEGWRRLRGGLPGNREWRALRIAVQHPLDIFAAVREADGAKAVLFECGVDAAPMAKLHFDSEGLLLVDERDAVQGRARAALVLERPDLESILLSIADDIIRASASSEGATSALLEVAARLSAWQTCLKLRRDGFSRERMLGLCGELVVLKRVGGTMDLREAIAAWTGPDRSIHDFQVHDRAIEVKATVGSGGALNISSLDQLDDFGLSSLLLVHVVLVPDDSGVGLDGLIVDIRSQTERCGNACRREFDRKLLMVGYLDGDVSVAERFERLAVRDVLGYRVDAEFPRMTRSTVPIGIVSAEYRLSPSLAGARPLDPEALETAFDSFSSGNP